MSDQTEVAVEYEHEWLDVETHFACPCGKVVSFAFDEERVTCDCGRIYQLVLKPIILTIRREAA